MTLQSGHDEHDDFLPDAKRCRVAEPGGTASERQATQTRKATAAVFGWLIEYKVVRGIRSGVEGSQRKISGSNHRLMVG